MENDQPVDIFLTRKEVGESSETFSGLSKVAEALAKSEIDGLARAYQLYESTKPESNEEGNTYIRAQKVYDSRIVTIYEVDRISVSNGDSIIFRESQAADWSSEAGVGEQQS